MQEVKELAIGNEVYAIKDEIARHKFDDTISMKRINRTLVFDQRFSKFLTSYNDELTITTGRYSQAQCYFKRNGIEYKAECVLSNESDYYSGMGTLNIVNLSDNSKQPYKIRMYHGNSIAYKDGKLFIACHGYQPGVGQPYTRVNKMGVFDIDSGVYTLYTMNNMTGVYGITYDDVSDKLYLIDANKKVYELNEISKKATYVFTAPIVDPYNSFVFQDFSISGRWLYYLTIDPINISVYDLISMKYITTIQFDYENSGYWFTGEPESIEVYQDGTFYIGSVSRTSSVNLCYIFMNQMFTGNIYKNTNYYPNQMHRDTHATLYVKAFIPTQNVESTNPNGSSSNPFDTIGEALARAECYPYQAVTIVVSGHHRYEYLSLGCAKNIVIRASSEHLYLGGAYLLGANVTLRNFDIYNNLEPNFNNLDAYTYGCVQANNSIVKFMNCRLFSEGDSRTTETRTGGALLTDCIGIISGSYNNSYYQSAGKREYVFSEDNNGNFDADNNILDSTTRLVANSLTYNVPISYRTPFNMIKLTVGMVGYRSRIFVQPRVSSMRTLTFMGTNYYYTVNLVIDNTTDGVIKVGGNMIRTRISDGSIDIYYLSDAQGPEDRPSIYDISYVNM